MWNLGFDFCCCCGGTSSTRQKHADTGSGPFFDADEEPGADVQRPERARLPSVPKSTVAGSGSSAPRGGGAWVSMRALASAAEADAALLVVVVVVRERHVRGWRRRSKKEKDDDDDDDGRRLKKRRELRFSLFYCTISLTCPSPAWETLSSCRRGRKRASRVRV